MYRRWMIKTHLVRPGERLVDTLAPYLEGRLEPGDILVLSEKIVAIAEGRAVLLKMVKPRPLARFLARHVRPLGYGIGFRRAETMEMAIREVGSLRIIMASAVGAVDRFVGRSGDFYRIAGRRVASIDGPGPTTIPPYNRYIVLAPRQPEQVLGAIKRRFGCDAAVVDVNDVGSEVLAATPGLDHELVRQLMRDNPMGQGAQGTPVAVLRPTKEDKPVSHWPDHVAPGGAAWVMPLGGSADIALRIGRESGDPDQQAVDL
nr:coenzyme F420-0:L-glutamate ligase [Sulfobacillus harzensis]